MREELGLQLSELFSAIIYFHKGGISKYQLIEYFWEDSENPANALKYAIYRLRNKLKKMKYFNSYEWILTKQDGYIFNNELKFTFDIDEFNKLLSLNKITQSDIDKVIKLYENGFLNSNNHLFVFNIRMFYEELYIQYVIKYCKECFIKKEYDTVLEIIEKAMLVESLNEQFILIYLKTLIETHKYNSALKYFKKISSEFYDAYKRPIGDCVTNLFDYYVETDEFIVEDIDEIANLISVKSSFSSPIFVKFMAFKQIYELIYNKHKRSHKHVSIVLVKLVTKKGLEEKMKVLRKIIDQHLRSSDVYCKLNDNQFLFIFSIEDYYDVFTIMSKLQAKFYSKCSRDEVKFHFYNRTIEQIQDFGN
jgi:DNA-binding SARP family transcriptional activator